MFKLPNKDKQPRPGLLWPLALIAFGWAAFGEAVAQNHSTDAKDVLGTQVSTSSTSKTTSPQWNAGKTESSDAAAHGPTYLGNIQPLFMGSCARCHNQQSRFVYDWLDYKTAYSDRWEIKRRVWDSWKNSYYKEPMPVANSPESLALTEEQRATIKAWVENGAPEGVAPTVPAVGTTDSKDSRIALGKQLFTACAACHQPSGQGVPNVFPPLAGSDFLNADKARAISIILHGKQGEVVVNGVKYSNSMPPFPLSDQNVANVLTYVYNSFGNSGVEVTPDEVKAQR